MTSVEDKENTSEVETITIIDDTDTEKKEDINTFFSPPKKRFKKDVVPFTKLPKNEENLKKDENDVQINLSDVARTTAENQPSDLTKKHESPVNTKTSKHIKSAKNVSPKISISPKNVPSEKKIKTAKNSNVNKTKDTKLDGIPFPKLSKEDALKESEKAVQNMMSKCKEQEKDESTGKNPEVNGIIEIGVVDDVQNTENAGNCETPIGKNPPSSTKKAISPLSKEERQKIKEEREMSKAARMKEFEEKRKKKEEERILKLAEKEKRENERKEKERLREEEKQKREEERKLREEEKQKKEEQLKLEKEKRDAERETKELERNAEREKKELERKMKEEQKRQEEEKKKQEDEALKKKKEKEASHFRSFFTKKRTTDTKVSTVESIQCFKPFQVKPDMVLAPLVRNDNINRELLDKILEDENPNLNTYLQEQAINLAKNKKTKYISRRKKRHDLEELHKLEIKKKSENVVKPVCNKGVDIQNVVVIDDNSNDTEDDEDNENETSVCDEKYLYVAKLLQFNENTRPSYYGTWRKKSIHISGRKPFARDTDTFNYDIVSDEEWIDEPGENLSDAPDEDEEEEKETEDDQDGFFVPHGYLSDDEGIKAEPDEEEENNSEEVSKCASADQNEEDKMKLKVCSFERRFQKKLKHQKPICIGITYNYSVDTVDPFLKDYIKVTLFKPVCDKGKEDDEDMEVTSPESGKHTPNTVGENSKNNPRIVPEEAMPILIRYLHGNVASLPTMVMTFHEYWNRYAKETEMRSDISKRQLEKKIHAIASRISNKEVGKMCYVVKDEVVTKYGMQNDLKYGEGLPDITSSNNTSIQPKSCEVEHAENNETIQNEVSIDTSMEIN